ncbi:DUF1292 domain-containing protein [Velocimicrobium porci]|uniref:DUF1292 domain-containing protein n=1 Tax=Velocimicrobium porci TaxID=2606634 RepID=A0A6L5Y0P5_9FIRM|nr:DUF1292 domain-containing protein [Velocimicrobium porci]MSS64407.1 DUF1292 domain-containing protein [Velocimicrobium porci]
MQEAQDKIVFTTEDGEQIEFFVLEQTKLAGETYLLVADSDEEEANALILKEIQGENKETVIYDTVEDEQELEALSKVFEELLDDIDIEME